MLCEQGNFLELVHLSNTVSTYKVIVLLVFYICYMCGSLLDKTYTKACFSPTITIDFFCDLYILGLC